MLRMNDTQSQTLPDWNAPETRVVKIHGPDAFAGMRKAGRLAAELLDEIGEHVKPGVNTAELDRICAEMTAARGAISAPMGYRGFPKSICTSVNHVVCHGIPSPDKILRDGDIINIDVTPIVDGWHGDSSRMYYVGDVGVKARRLVEVTYDAMMPGIEIIKPGATLGDAGHPIHAHRQAQRHSVVRRLPRHGVGQLTR